jgi:hypothetical protein
VNRKVFGIAVVFMIVAMLALPISAVLAETPTQITGKWRFTGFLPPGVTLDKKAGANAFLTMHNSGEYFEGPLIGTFDNWIALNFHYGDPEIVAGLPDSPPYSVYFGTPKIVDNRKMMRTFTGTVMGYAGTLTISLERHWVPGLGVMKNSWHIMSGTGELANIHGQGTWWTTSPGNHEYEGTIHFAP